MQAIVLAAGEGTRMRPLTHSTPKPMLPVGDRPLVAHTASGAIEAGADELVFVVGYEADTVRSYFGDRYQGVPVSYAVQDEQLGTAHAVRCAREFIDGPFVVLNGDDLYDQASLNELFDGGPAIGSIEVDNPSNYGVLSLNGETVTEVIEKPAEPPSNLVNAGAYKFPATARDELDVEMSERGEYELTDVLDAVIDTHDIRAVVLDRWLGVGRPWELLAANEWKLGDCSRQIDGEVHDSAELRGPVVVAEGATIDAGTVIEGPVRIESGAEVGPNAYIRGATRVGSDCHIGNGAEVKNSVLMAGANVPHLSYVGDSLLGPAVNLGAGTQVANLRHDDADIEQTVKGERVSTGRRKYGIVAGDGAKTGVNTSLAPGVVLSAGATTLPGEQVLRDR